MLEQKKVENFVKRHPQIRLEVREVGHGSGVTATEYRFEVEKNRNVWVVEVHDLGESAHAHMFALPRNAEGRALIWASVFNHYTYPISSWDELKKKLQRIVKYYD